MLLERFPTAIVEALFADKIRSHKPEVSSGVVGAVSNRDRRQGPFRG